MDDQYLTARQVSELFQLKIKTVYAAAADGRLPSVCLWKGKRNAWQGTVFFYQQIKNLVVFSKNFGSLERNHMLYGYMDHFDESN